MMKEGIDVTGIPGPNPIVLCLKAENHGNKV